MAKKPAKEKKPRKVPLEERCLLPEALTGASGERDLCVKCGLFNAKKPPSGVTVPEGWTRRLLVVCEQPQTDKDASLVRGWLAVQGFKRTDVAFTNAVRCARKDDPNVTQIRCCRPFLLHDLAALAPTTVLGFGNVALAALTNDGAATVTRNRGRLLDVPGSNEEGATTPPIIPQMRDLSSPVGMLCGSVRADQPDAV